MSTDGPWPSPHPVIDAPYGPRYSPPPPPQAPLVHGLRSGWDLTPLEAPRWSRRRAVVFIAVAVVMIVLGALMAYRFVTGPGVVSTWDPRVSALAHFDEQATGWTFTHPVTVHLVTDAAFTTLVTRAPTTLSAAERDAQADQEAVGRALGWYTGSTNLLDQRNRLDAADVLAFYRFDHHDIVARTPQPDAPALSVELRVTIVHELVHALQDQHLSVSRLDAAATSSQAQQALTSVIEGQAVDVENRYIASLSSTDAQAYQASLDAASRQVAPQTAQVAPVLSVELALPYAYGPVLAQAARLSAGGIEQLFSQPPIDEAAVIDPRVYFERRPSVAAPTPAVHPKALATDSVGPVRLYLMLSGALDPAQAWDVAAGWANDIEQPYRSSVNGSLCLDWEIATTSSVSATRLQTALEAWASQRPSASLVRVAGSGTTVRVQACDPGTATSQALASDAAVQFFYVRADLEGALLERSGRLDQAACATDSLMHTEAVASLAAPDAAEQTRIDAALATCAPH